MKRQMPDIPDTAGYADGKITEKQVVRLWQYQLLDKITGLTTEDGIPLEILYPGRPNDDRGADFRDAVISSNRLLLKGDVELHVRSSDWHAHGHDRDAAYNRVILHVVMWHDCRKATALANGKEVPVLALVNYLHPGCTAVPPCGRANPAYTGIVLDKAGDARFRAKAGKMLRRLTHAAAGQVLYEGIMEALGYAKNKAPFLELSRLVNLKSVESVTGSSLPDQECVNLLQRLLMGAAETISGWNTFKVRPGNSPARRIMAICRLLVRFRARGLLTLTERIVNADNAARKYSLLEKALVVTASGSRDGNSFTLLGPGRAADIVVNVLLPFSYALGRAEGRPKLKRKALELYRDCPGEISNSIVRHMTGQLGLQAKDVNTARRQQGLLHIHRGGCIQGRCCRCPLSQLQSGGGIQVEAVPSPGLEAVIAADGNHGRIVGA